MLTLDRSFPVGNKVRDEHFCGLGNILSWAVHLCKVHQNVARDHCNGQLHRHQDRHHAVASPCAGDNGRVDGLVQCDLSVSGPEEWNVPYAPAARGWALLLMLHCPLCGPEVYRGAIAEKTRVAVPLPVAPANVPVLLPPVTV